MPVIRLHHLDYFSQKRSDVRELSMSLLILGEIGRFMCVRLDRTSSDLDTYPVICPLNMTSSRSQLSSLRRTKRILGRRQLSLQVKHFPMTSSTSISSCLLAGNIAIGNLQLFLPYIVQLVKQDDSKRLLALHALKEVVTHTSTSHLENLADTLWAPLFENSESADESSRGVAAACIGKLITTHPARYLPQVHVRTQIQSLLIQAHDCCRPAFAILTPQLVQPSCPRSDTPLLTRLLPLTRSCPHTSSTSSRSWMIWNW